MLHTFARLSWLSNSRFAAVFITAFACSATNVRGSDDILDKYYREILVPSVKSAYSTAFSEQGATNKPSRFEDIERLYRAAPPNDRATLAVFLMIKADYQGEYAYRFARLIREDLEEIRKRVGKLDRHSLEDLCRLLNVDPSEALRKIQYFSSGKLTGD